MRDRYRVLYRGGEGETVEKKSRFIPTYGKDDVEQLPLTFAISEKEENLIQMIADYAEIVKEAGKLYSPACVANYIYDLVKEYNQFYHDFSILREENPELKNFRLVLSANVAKIVKSGMDLLGIEVPERM